MSLQNVEAQLGNLLSAMPLKLQKVSPTFLDTATPPFEGAMASDAQGQFYVSDFNDQGDLSWKQIIDNTARQAAAGESNSEVVLQYDLPVGFESSTITFGKTLTGSQFSAFVQYEPPGGDDMTMYVFAVKNITSTQFDLHVSDTIGEAGGKLHIFAKGYESSGTGNSGGDSSNDGDSSGGDSDSPDVPEPEPTLSDVIDMSPEFWWHFGDAYTDSAMTTAAADGDSVVAVADQSSNNRTLIASSVHYAPALNLSGTNGQPCVSSNFYENDHGCRFKLTPSSDISGPACIYLVVGGLIDSKPENPAYNGSVNFAPNGTLWTSTGGSYSGFSQFQCAASTRAFKVSFGSDGDYLAANILDYGPAIYQVYASGTEIGIRKNGGALYPNNASAPTPNIENFAIAGETWYFPFGPLGDWYEMGFIPDVTHDQDKVFRYLGSKYNIGVTDVS